MRHKLRVILTSTAALIMLGGTHTAGASFIELSFGGELYHANDDDYDSVELTLVYDPSRANPDADPDPNIGVYQGDFAVGAALVVNGAIQFFCGTVDGFGSQGTCLAEPGLSLMIVDSSDNFESVSFGYGLDPCPWTSTVESCQSILQDSVSGAELFLFNINWQMQGVLDGDSIYQLPGPHSGSNDSRYKGSGFNIIFFREDKDAGYDIWEEGKPWGLISARYVSEPSTIVLLVTGLAGMGLARRRRTQ